MNLLLWGCESWALRQTLLNKLDVFFHRSIRHILGITMTQVIEGHIKNETIRAHFNNIPTIRQHIKKRQLTFIGKVFRNHDSQIPTKLLTAWCDHPQRRGGVLQSNKKNLSQNIQLITPSAANDGCLSSWVFYALDSSLWNYLVSQLGNIPRSENNSDHYKPPPPLNYDPNPPSTPPPQQRRRAQTTPPPSSPPHNPPSPQILTPNC